MENTRNSRHRDIDTAETIAVLMEISDVSKRLARSLARLADEALMNEKRFLACLSLIQRMRNGGLLSDAEYTHARQLILAQYRPKISDLFE